MKKLWTLLCVVLCIFGMTACGGSSDKEEDAVMEQYADLQESMENRLVSLLELSEDEVNSQLSEVEAKAWLDVAPELGEYVGLISLNSAIEQLVAPSSIGQLANTGIFINNNKIKNFFIN